MKHAVYEDDEIDLPPINDEDEEIEVSDDEFDVDTLPDDDEEELDTSAEDEEKVRLREEKSRLEAELSRKTATEIETAQGMIAGEEQRLKTEEVALKAVLKRAIEEGDSDKQIELNDKLLDLKVRAHNVSLAKQQIEQVKAQPQKPRLHPRAESWAAQNKWFSDPNHVSARDHVVTFAARLEQQGIGPDRDEYYERINAEVNKRFPEVRAAKKRPPGNVAAAQRAPSRGREGREKVTLDATQVAFARKHGIPLKLVAEEKRKLKRVEV